MVFPFLEVSGDNYSCGLQIGKRFRENIKKSIDESFYYKWLRKQHDRDPSRLVKFLELSKATFPQYIRELEGISDGADIPALDIFLLKMTCCWHL